MNTKRSRLFPSWQTIHRKLCSTNNHLCASPDEKQQDMSLSISTNGNASITVSVEVNGTIYSGLYEDQFVTKEIYGGPVHLYSKIKNVRTSNIVTSDMTKT